MLLCISVAGDDTALGVFDGDRLQARWRVSTLVRRTADEWRLLLGGLVTGRVDGVSTCSTVPAALAELRTVLAIHYADVPCVIVEPGVRTGLKLATDNPREIGADRILNALAASRLHGAPCIAVGFGLATTYDVVNPLGEYVGGAIGPGIGLSLEALGRAGAQLRHVELTRPRSAIARNTVEALQSGAIFGAAGQFEGIVRRMADELGVERHRVTVVATGPLAEVVLADCDGVDVHDPWLTLRGLRLAHERAGV